MCLDIRKAHIPYYICMVHMIFSHTQQHSHTYIYTQPTTTPPIISPLPHPLFSFLFINQKNLKYFFLIKLDITKTEHKVNPYLISSSSSSISRTLISFINHHAFFSIVKQLFTFFFQHYAFLRFLLLILPRSLLSSLSLLFPDSIATRSFHFWSSTSRSVSFFRFYLFFVFYIYVAYLRLDYRFFLYFCWFFFPIGLVFSQRWRLFSFLFVSDKFWMIGIKF